MTRRTPPPPTILVCEEKPPPTCVGGAAVACTGSQCTRLAVPYLASNDDTFSRTIDQVTGSIFQGRDI